MRKYLRGKWPDPVVPAYAPVWMHYELNVNENAVLRTVDVYADGAHIRNSLALEERDGYPCVSLVHGPFDELTADWPLDEINAREFEALWNQSIDKPYP